jgi:hypothetical protein
MPNKKLGLIAILASVAAGNLFADITNYAVGDVLLSFRKTGGANDLVVDAGPVSTFTSATLNQRIPITQFTGSQLGGALNATNGISWSAFAYYDDTVSPNWTLCMTRARSLAHLNIQSTPWPAGSAGGQAIVINTELSTVAAGANGNFGAGLNDPRSTSTAVIEPDSSTGSTSGDYTVGQSYHSALDPLGGGDDNFGGFTGNPENTTTNNPPFTAPGTVVRSDFYYIPPTGSGSVTYLGYFELSNNLTMTFVGKPTAVPLLKTFIRTNGVATMTYKTGIYGTYTLLGTNKLTSSSSFSTWPAVGGTLSTGDNLTHTVQDTDSVSNKFYILQGQ